MERGQFFSIDVFIATVVLVSGSIVLLYSISGSSDLQPAQLFNADLLRETITKSIRELNYQVLTNPNNDIGFANASNPYDIKDFDKTLGEMIGEYHHLANVSFRDGDFDAYRNYTLRRDEITRQTIAPLISAQYSYRISLVSETDGDVHIVNRTRIPFDEAEYRVATRSIIAGIDRNREFYGPTTIEVVVWN